MSEEDIKKILNKLTKDELLDVAAMYIVCMNKAPSALGYDYDILNLLSAKCSHYNQIVCDCTKKQVEHINTYMSASSEEQIKSADKTLKSMKELEKQQHRAEKLLQTYEKLMGI